MESDTLLLVNERPGMPNILGKGRRITDSTYIYTLTITVCFWIALLIFARVTGNSDKILSEDLSAKIVATLTVSRIFTIIGFTLVAGLCCLAYVAILRKVGHFVSLVFGVSWLPFVASVIFLATWPNFFTLYGLLTTLCSAIITQVLIHSEWFYLPEAIIRETCRFLRANGRLVMFSLMWYKLCLLVVTLGTFGHLYLQTLTVLDEDGLEELPIYVKVLTLLNVMITHWVTWVFLNFGQMVIAGTMATRFWASRNDKAVEPAEADNRNKNVVGECFKLVGKYHIGTAANGAWIFGTFYSLMTLARVLEEKLRENRRNKKLWWLVVANLFDAVVLRFTMCSAVSVCAIHAQNYEKSVAIAVGHLTRHTRKCLLIAKMTEWILLIGTMTIYFLLLILTLGSVDPEIDPEEFNVIVAFIAAGSLMFILPTFAMLSTGFNALLLCILEDEDLNDGSPDKPYRMNEELREAMARSGPPTWYRQCY
ncbi:CTL-like protein 2 isoform X1 [Trichogramma pretiosum]|uniref:CTL-like protein 2 isoform X1 n=2 Tax=Trichogramma pretiosum TaxID=7493 RepID=UPI0006C9CE9D|nr:CTL-like protein 2 isoform X1 [Trichogramma pretiosum]